MQSKNPLNLIGTIEGIRFLEWSVAERRKTDAARRVGPRRVERRALRAVRCAVGHTISHAVGHAVGHAISHAVWLWATAHSRYFTGGKPIGFRGVDPDAVVVNENVSENDRLHLLPGQPVRGNAVVFFLLQRCPEALHSCIVKAMTGSAQALHHPAGCQRFPERRARVKSVGRRTTLSMSESTKGNTDFCEKNPNRKPSTRCVCQAKKKRKAKKNPQNHLFLRIFGSIIKVGAPPQIGEENKKRTNISEKNLI